MVVWVLPFYVAFGFAYLFPFLLPYAIPIGLSVTIGGLFWQIIVNQYQAQQFNLVVMFVDRKPRAHGVTFRDYWKWESAVQLWIKGQPREFVDQDGWTTAYLHLLNGGVIHPFYNSGQHIHWFKFRYIGTWNDLIRYDEGEGFYKGSVVDMKNVCRIWVSEIVAEAMPDPRGKSGRELLNLTPSLIREEEDGIEKWIPVFIIKRADGTIDMELKKEEALIEAMRKRKEKEAREKLLAEASMITVGRQKIEP